MFLIKVDCLLVKEMMHKNDINKSIGFPIKNRRLFV